MVATGENMCATHAKHAHDKRGALGKTTRCGKTVEKNDVEWTNQMHKPWKTYRLTGKRAPKHKPVNMSWPPDTCRNMRKPNVEQCQPQTQLRQTNRKTRIQSKHTQHNVASGWRCVFTQRQHGKPKQSLNWTYQRTSLGEIYRLDFEN